MIKHHTMTIKTNNPTLDFNFLPVNSRFLLDDSKISPPPQIIEIFWRKYGKKRCRFLFGSHIYLRCTATHEKKIRPHSNCFSANWWQFLETIAITSKQKMNECIHSHWLWIENFYRKFHVISSVSIYVFFTLSLRPLFEIICLMLNETHFRQNPNCLHRILLLFFCSAHVPNENVWNLVTNR